MSSTARVAVLVSGSGSNLQALLDATADPWFAADIVKVVANVPGVYALDRASHAGVPSAVVDHRGKTREAFEAELLAHLGDVDIVCLAGFMRVLTGTFLNAFPHRVMNIHPALLPAFPGIHGPRQALAHGVTQAGATCHLVDAGVDTGPILAQGTVPVLPGDTEASLAACSNCALTVSFSICDCTNFLERMMMTDKTMRIIAAEKLSTLQGLPNRNGFVRCLSPWTITAQFALRSQEYA